MATSSALREARERASAKLAARVTELKAAVAKHSPAPYQDMLALMLAKGEKINWSKLAQRNPFQFIQALEKLALLSGYTPDAYKQQLNLVVVEGMSDTDLLAALALARSKTSACVTIDHEPQPSEPANDIYKVARTVPASEADAKQEPCQSSEQEAAQESCQLSLPSAP